MARSSFPGARARLLACAVLLCGGPAHASPADDALSRWLYGLSVAIPDVAVTEAGVAFTLSGAACTKFVVGALGASEGAENGEPTVSLTVSNVGLECVGAWAYQGANPTHLPRGSGGLVAIVGGETGVAVSVTVGGANGWPDSVKLTDCSTVVEITDLQFTGPSISSKILELLRSVIADALSKTLGDLVCTAVTPLVDRNLTHVIRSSNVYLQSCGADAAFDEAQRLAHVAAVAASPDVVDWEGVPLLPEALAFASSLADCALGDSLAIRAGVTLGPFQIGGIGNVTVLVDELNVSTARSGVRLFAARNASLGVYASAAALNASARLGVVVDAPLAGPTALVENFVARLLLMEPKLVAEAQVAVSQAGASQLQIGDFRQVDTALVCGAGALRAANVTRLRLDAAKYGAALFPVAESGGALEFGLDEMLSVVLDVVVGQFPALISTALTCGLGLATKAANDAVEARLQTLHAQVCPAPERRPGDVRWNESKALALVDRFVDASLIDWASDCVNPAAVPATERLLAAAPATAPTDLLGAAAAVGLDIDVLGAAVHVSVGGYDKWTELAPVKGVSAETLFFFGNLSAMTLSVGVAFGGHTYALEVAPRDLAASLTATVRLRDAEFSALTFGAVSNADCNTTLAFREAPRIETASLTNTALHWNVSGLGANNVGLPAVLDAAVAWAAQWLLEHPEKVYDVVNVQLAKRFDAWGEEACGVPSSSSSSKSKVRTLAGVVGGVGGLAIIAAFLLRRRRRSQLMLSASPPGRGALSAALLDDANFEGSLELDGGALELDGWASGEATSAVVVLGASDVPLALRLLVPALIVLNMALYLWSNLTPAASVNVELDLLQLSNLPAGGYHVDLGSFFDFSLSNSVRDMWAAKVYPLSMLIAACSGGWPYLKLGLMLFCWSAPAAEAVFRKDRFRVLSLANRGRILVVIDGLGKFSLVDTFVMILMMVAFHLEITIGAGGVLEEAFVVHVYVEALPSFYRFVFATCLSLMLGHVVVALHRRQLEALASPNTRRFSRDDVSDDGGRGRVSLMLVSPLHGGACSARDPLFDDEEDDSAEALCCHAFDECPLLALQSRSKAESGARQLSRGSQSAVVALLLAASMLLLYGTSIDSFDFRIQGAAGWIMGRKAQERFSIISLGRFIPSASKDPSSPGAVALEVVYFIYALALPLLQLPCLLCLWLAPLRLQTQKRFYVACEVVNAWAALDVFMLAIIAAMTQISQFAAFMVGSKCDGLNVVLDAALRHETHGICFDVQTQLNKGAWVLFASALISLAVSRAVMHVASVAIDERTARRRELRAARDERTPRPPARRNDCASPSP
ncbi:hypothetical protein M885DRAFT_521109 [Pelagophyceae sp. CCMP2097]|nr:hypothetical protein M885DRAFT_521109 [Pelagophyceae sp. CCMP2097]|mmetsp:Transcript_18581/g.66142  ORF Transcript_18581/g.66142 Transcript_18581/m.66142 type:complete len:1326 (+) Transcript_18581:181-4158(+)